MPRAITGDALVELLASSPPSIGDVFILEEAPTVWDPAVLATAPCIIVGRVVSEIADVVAPDDDTQAAILETVEQAPIASAALAVHLRTTANLPIAEGLVAESAVYSMLQAGPEFAAWRAGRPVRQRPPSAEPAVVVDRRGDDLSVELNRPEVRNAFNVAIRDGLLEALAIAVADPAVRVAISGRGPAFCAGGDLDEFGSFPDAASAHLIRLARSVGAVMARIADRVTVRLHGACYGSGIEIPAFAGQVIAAADTSIALPELGLGLIPGAGGTASLPARIGRHKTALLAFSRQPIDAATALQWGLVDTLT